MRIKELKLFGFKSFSTKTTIKFDHNFIGIVGPNGSGKSNIIDAIRWVFGEHSNKSLRGSNATDIIFNGTQTKKRLNVAEVTIVLDNEDGHLPIDYSEVAITRRVYRTGNSEYLLNGTECRLKDITELILDTGMGKSSFSIISQGKIESIIMDSPENRRAIVEEVAGVLKYKKRKETTVRKLVKVEQNLSQVDLILGEMFERIEPLRIQSEKAQNFLKLKEQLDVKELTYLANAVQLNSEKYNALKQIIEENSVEQIALDNQISADTTAISQLNEQINEVEISKNQINNLIVLKNREISELSAKYQILQDRRANIKDLNDGQKRKLELEQKIFEVNLEMSTITAQIEQLELNLVNELKLETDFLNLQNQKQQEISKVVREKNDLERELASHDIPFATRKVLEQNLPGIHSYVSKLFTVDQKYAEAINSAIGGRLNEIVTEDKHYARQAIDFLKQHQFGRQTFIPIDDVHTMKVDSKIHQELAKVEGFVGIGIDVISFEEKYTKVFEHLLGAIIIASDMNAAFRISKITNRYRIVTLDGEVVAQSGTLTGGRHKRQNRFIIENKLQKINDKLAELEQKNTQTFDYAKKNKLTSELQINQHKYGIQAKEKQLLELEFGTLDSTKEEFDATEIFELTAKIEELKKLISSEEIRLVELENAEYELKKVREEKQLDMRETNERFKLLSRKLSEAEGQIGRLEVTLKNDIMVLNEEYSITPELAYRKVAHDINLEEYQKDVAKLKREIRAIGPINTLAIEEYEEVSTRYNFIDSQKTDLLSAKEKLEIIINKLDVFFIETFVETYEKLRVEFQQVFKELFGGGYADLVLTNPDDYLNTGIEIVAQPPGKKLQTISLLSGGEKAFTAISLLFAILRIRTVPFAILDEVEAALDEVNVKRYAKYLKIFSEKTQFLVITHRRGTMESVDTLYGITMQEKGVSSILNVTLEEKEQYVQED
ncbi:MAG: AAA family ATPase [Mycoplasmatales bacterium]